MNKISLFTDADIRQTFLETLAYYFENNENVFNKLHNPPPNKKRYYTRKETAKELNISLPTLTKYVKNDLIKCKRIGSRILFTREDIDNAIVNRKIN